MKRVSNAELSELIALIYESALNHKAWQLTIERLSNLFGGPGGIFVQDLDSADASFFVSVLPEQYVASYASHYSAVNPWLPKVKNAASGTIVLAQNLLTRREYERTEFFNDWMKPQNLYHNSGIIIDNRSRIQTNLSFCRAISDSEFEGEDVELYELLKPHLQRAIEIHRRIFSAGVLGGSALQILERLDLGVAIVSHNATMVFSNAALLRILEQNRGLLERAGRLRPTNADDDKKLQHLIRGALEPCEHDNAVRVGGLLRIQRGNAAFLSVAVSPLPPGINSLPAALIFVSDSASVRPPTASVLKSLFGLTNTEAQLFKSLLEGKTLKEYAEAKGISLNTGRTLLKRIFIKVGSGRQSDLVRLGWADLAPRLIRDTG